MKVRELIRYTGGLLRGRQTRTMIICALPLAAELFFRFAEAAAFSLLLYFSGSRAIRLFGGNSGVQLAVTAVCTLLRWVTAAPLMYAAAYSLYGITGENPRSMRLSRLLLRKRTLRRSISAALWTKVIGLLALVPVIFFAVMAYELTDRRLRGASAFLFGNAVLLAVIFGLLWLSLKLSFTAVPFLLVRFPQLTAFRTVIFSISFMQGRRSVLLRLIAAYLPQMLTVAGIPFAVSKLMSAFSLSIDIFIKEDEYLETDRADGGHRKARNSGAIPHKKKRRVKTAADKA
jgi:hypothetical protein